MNGYICFSLTEFNHVQMVGRLDFIAKGKATAVILQLS